MKEYLFLFRGGLDFKTAPKEEVEAQLMRWQKWNSELEKENRLVAGQRLMPGGRVLTGVKMEVTDGASSEGKEIIGGFILIKANGFDDAAKIAIGCPIFPFGGSVEIREIASSR